MTSGTEPAPRLTIQSIVLLERDVRLRMPFRFGVVTLTAAPQAFARVRVRLHDGRESEGAAAELLAPKWFDKNPALSNEDNFDQLRASLGIARTLYLSGDAATPFEHFTRHYPEQIRQAAGRSLNSLVANYGPALIDRAVIDALCRALGRSFHDVIRHNLAGIGATPLCPDLAGFDFTAFLAGLQPASTISARHTVGLVDPITAADQPKRVDDGLPETLEEVVATYGHRWFKLKVGGELQADVERLGAIAGVLDRLEGGYRATLDGNEQYEDVDGVLELWHRMKTEPRLARLCRNVSFIEQPIKRQAALSQNVSGLSTQKPVIIDESDDSLDAFVRSRQVGYTGVSSKTCKGFYKSLINRARCLKWNREESRDEVLDPTNPRYLMSAEDLTIQAGLALQQDLALVSLMGIRHVERNGHHYVNGMAGLPQAEQDAFLAAHPDLYERSHGAVRLRIRDGTLAIGSLGCAGFASGALPDWSDMRPMSLVSASSGG
ncbi:MAG: mandelate racemase [Lautropia sp.]|nr:mandelate racemase [Lautropia sp.]